MPVPVLIGCYPASGELGESGAPGAPDDGGAGLWRVTFDEETGAFGRPGRLVALASASFLAWEPGPWMEAAVRPGAGFGASAPRHVHVAVEADQGEVVTVDLGEEQGSLGTAAARTGIAADDAGRAGSAADDAASAGSRALAKAASGAGAGAAADAGTAADGATSARVAARVATGGSLPCHVLRPEGWAVLAVANYGDGAVTGLPIRDGLPVAGPGPFRFAGSGPVADRQDGPHAHSCVQLEPGLLAMCDLGADALRFFAIGPSGLTPLPEVARLAPGTGPRHALTHPATGLLYVTAELSADIVALARDGLALTEIQRLPASAAAGAGDNLPSHLALATAGDLLYVANRGPGTISAFAIGSDGLLTPAGESDCGVPWPRHFAVLPAPDGGDWLIVAGQGSCELTVLRRAPGEAGPGAIVSRLALPAAPVCVLPFPPGV